MAASWPHPSLFIACIYGLLFYRTNGQEPVTNTECDVGPNALFFLPAPQTCIAVEGNPGPRCWYTYIPPNAPATDESGVPLVVDMHGYTSCAQYNPFYTGWKERADADGFVVVYPQGNADASVSDTTCFDAGICCCHEGTDFIELPDVEFVRQLVADTVASSPLPIDTRRIYMAGHSNGCMMAQRLAAELSDVVAAVGCHSGLQIRYESIEDFPADYQPTPVMTIFGDADQSVPYEGGTIPLPGVQELTFPSAENNTANWAAANQCTDGPMITEDESGTYATHVYTGCGGGDNATVELLQLFGVGHSPFKEIPGSTSMPNGTFETEIDTTKMAQEFCFQYASKDAPLLPPCVSCTDSDNSTEAPTAAPDADNSTEAPTATPGASTEEPTTTPTAAPTSAAATRGLLTKSITTATSVLVAAFCFAPFLF